MAKTNTTPASEQETNTTPDPEQETKTTPAQEPDVNEADGEPIFHADEEEGDDNE